MKPHHKGSSKLTDLKHHAYWQAACLPPEVICRQVGGYSHQRLLGVIALFPTQAGASIRKETPHPRKGTRAGSCTDGKHRAPRSASQPASKPGAALSCQQPHPYLPELTACLGDRDVGAGKGLRTRQGQQSGGRDHGGKARAYKRWGSQAGCLLSATFPSPCEAMLSLPSLPWKSL